MTGYEEIMKVVQANYLASVCGDGAMIVGEDMESIQEFIKHLYIEHLEQLVGDIDEFEMDMPPDYEAGYSDFDTESD